MLKFILLLILTQLHTLSHAQSLQDWQKSHPAILLIHELDASDNYLKKLDKKGVQYIVYSGDLSLENINAGFSSSQKSLNYEINENDGDAIKLWLAKNSDVKILTRSYYESLTESKKQLYFESRALILMSDELTYQDIQNYESQNVKPNTH